MEDASRHALQGLMPPSSVTCIKIAKEGWRVHTVMPIMWPAESQAVGPFAVDGEADLDIKILFEPKLT